MKITPLIISCMFITAASLHSATIWWTGGGDGESWSDPANWSGGVPVSGDDVRLGNAGDTENPVANTPQTIILDVNATFGRLFLDNVGNRSVSLTSVDGESLTLNGSNSRVTMSATAASDAFLDVTIASASDYTNSSTSNLIYLGPNSTASITQAFGGGGFRLAGTTTGTLRVRNIQNFYVDGMNHTGTFQVDSRPNFKMESDGSINLLMAFNAINTNWATIERIGAGDRTLTINAFTVQTVSSQAANNWSNSAFSVIDNPEDEGHLTLRVNRWSTPSGGGPGLTPHIVTDANTTVELFGASGNMTPGVIGSERITGITGPGNLHMKMDAAGSLFTLQRMTDYTGRTILEQGTMAIGSMTITAEHRSSTLATNPTTPGTYYGSLPLATLLEIGENATLRLNAGFGQTVGGITGYNGTHGTVDMNGAELTINATEDSSFSGTISGTGSLIKSGDATFTFADAYTNPAGRTLRVDNGVFAVDGALSVVDGIFELAGGQITATSLIATDVTWNVILAATAANSNMVAVTNADITGATLSLDLGQDYNPTIGTQFTLLYASDSITGASESNMFGYNDGDTFLLNGTEFSINWVLGSESIVLTVIPEPHTYATLLALACALLALARRRRQPIG